MRFWDSSAVVPLCLAEPQTPVVRQLAEADPAVVVWWGTRTECVSAVRRGQRDRDLDAARAEHARTILERLASQWSEVQPSEPLRVRAERLLAVHLLRAADAFQLAAALLWSRGETVGRHVVSFDQRLREAARREGFTVLP
jgi:predicted nucleic acid-binding protein